jgi:predicted MFS family arabinose efflux permease
MAILFAFGFQASIWGTTASAVRQRAVPENLQGRVGAVYMLGVFGGLVFGNAIGAIIAGVWGVLAPFWFGFVGSAILPSSGVSFPTSCTPTHLPQAPPD